MLEKQNNAGPSFTVATSVCGVTAAEGPSSFLRSKSSGKLSDTAAPDELWPEKLMVISLQHLRLTFLGALTEHLDATLGRLAGQSLPIPVIA